MYTINVYKKRSGVYDTMVYKRRFVMYFHNKQSYVHNKQNDVHNAQTGVSNTQNDVHNIQNEQKT